MAHPNTLTRIACSTWLNAFDSMLTPEERDWLRTRLESRTPFNTLELERIKDPLLAWCARRGIAEKVAEEFTKAHI